MSSLEFRRSRPKLLALVVMGIGLVATSAFVAMRVPGPVSVAVGWFGVAFFGFALVKAVGETWRGGVGLRLDSFGIADFRTGAATPWSNVSAISETVLRGNRFLSLTLRQPELVLNSLSPIQRRLALLNRGLGYGDIAVSFTGLTPDISAAWAFLAVLPEASHLRIGAV